MEKNKIFGQLKTANLLLCLLLTVGVLPVLIWHSWGVLSGLSRVSLLGYGIADLALWSAALWSASAPSALIRGVALACKAALAGLLLLCAATVIALHAGDQRRVSLAEESARLEARRLATIAEHAERLSASSGRSVAREFVEAAGGSSPAPSQPDAGQAWREYLPEWWDTLGIVAVPPLAGLAVLVLLSAVIGLSAPEAPEAAAVSAVGPVYSAPAAPSLTPAYAQTEPIPTATAPTRSAPTASKPRPSGRFRLGFSGPRQSGASVRSGASAGGGGAVTPTADGRRVRYETKKDGRVEAWLDAPDAPRGKVYLTSFGRDLPEEQRQTRLSEALAKRQAAG
jgi:hypothetical protein